MTRNYGISIVIIAALCIFITSCGKHMYVMSGKEIDDYAEKAREPGLQSFVEYTNGDTIKGATIKKRQSAWSSKPTWTLDGKEIQLANIKSYQDQHGYRTGGYSRLIRGKLNLYMSQVDNSRMVGGVMKGSTTTTFYMNEGGPIQTTTLNSLLALKGCPAVLEQVDKEFKNTIWYKKRSIAINDYRALINVIEIYNNCH